MEDNKPTNSDKFKNSICYVPFGWIVLFFTEETKSKELMKHIKYGTFLLIAFMVIQFIIVWVLSIPLWWILFLIYAWITGFLWFKAHNWEDINLEYIDDFEKKIKDNMNDNTVVKTEKTTEKTEEKVEETKKVEKTEESSEKKDEDVLDF